MIQRQVKAKDGLETVQVVLGVTGGDAGAWHSASSPKSTAMSAAAGLQQ